MLLAASGTALACSVPVFRYALERWPPDRYLAVVFHATTLAPSEAAGVEELRRRSQPGEAAMNLVVRTVDLASDSEPALRRFWRGQPAPPPLPALVLFPPAGTRQTAPAWWGGLDAASVRQLADSPTRREVARRLVAGESAVWVLLESGDDIADTAARRTLATRLQHLESTLVLPEIDPADVTASDARPPTGRLAIRFSLLRVSRHDPAERVLAAMLLHTEEDLASVRAPMAFPVFGRGRTLPALVGAGINPAMIDETCAFLTGACSCLVKDQNPGTDLLLAVDWDALIEPIIRPDDDPPPLPGLAEFAGAEAASARAAPAAAAPNPAAAPRVIGLWLQRAAWFAALGGGLLVAGTWWLLRPRG